MNDDKANLSGTGQVLFEFVRHWSRRWNTSSDTQMVNQGRYVLVTEAVLSLKSRLAVTVNAVAHEIGIDQSGASRLIRNAEKAGYLTLRPATNDARTREVFITAAGIELLQNAHEWQETTFEQLTKSWTSQQRREFHRAMLDLLKRSHQLEP